MTLLSLASKQIWPQVLAVLHARPQRLVLFCTDEESESRRPAERLRDFFRNEITPMKTLHDLIADKLERADAESRQAFLRIPLENIDRWIANGHTAPHRLEQWRQIILRAQESTEGFQALLVLLRDRRPDTERIREFAPFAGVLTAAERAVLIRQCAYSH